MGGRISLQKRHTGDEAKKIARVMINGFNFQSGHGKFVDTPLTQFICIVQCTVIKHGEDCIARKGFPFERHSP